MNQITPDDSRTLVVKLSLSEDELIAVHEAAENKNLPVVSGSALLSRRGFI